MSTFTADFIPGKYIIGYTVTGGYSYVPWSRGVCVCGKQRIAHKSRHNANPRKRARCPK